MTVRDLDLATAQNMWGDVRLTRNATLLPGIATNPAFVYAVPPRPDADAGDPARLRGGSRST